MPLRFIQSKSSNNLNIHSEYGVTRCNEPYPTTFLSGLIFAFNQAKDAVNATLDFSSYLGEVGRKEGLKVPSHASSVVTLPIAAIEPDEGKETV